jgi:HCOMODA/2-hydroxy-3-carboxy-muconic semialdehyde decarboxylase
MESVQILVRKAARALVRHGLANAYGHCSARLDHQSFVVCAAKPMGLIKPAEPGVVVPIDGPLPKGVLGEVRAHQQIYKRRNEIHGICRFLSPKVLSISALGQSPQVRHGFGSYFAPEPPLWRSTTLLRSDERAAGVADALGQARAIILRGNGAITVGETLQQAVILAWYLEDMARVELDVLSARQDGIDPYSSTEAAERATFEGGVIERMWDYMTNGDDE